ncbi:NADH-quinone oxidoreductase subunit N [Arcticibacter eurypsychrophilus]|uniref:NADH-quinone oxidoreductase subunit N n=1 Tax=Arcticibacter eurypsychrophilus TaxID=1434752 RepID=UPI00084DF3ED|nr:NADH-quinone oxidoreductase subunit N [Arcticibacter eurypsychrophilus]
MNEFTSILPELIKNIITGMPHFLPEIVLIITFIVVILVDLFYPGKKSVHTYVLVLTGIVVSAFFTIIQYQSSINGISVFNDSLKIDRIGIIFKLLFSAVVILYAIFIKGNIRMQNHNKGIGDLYMLLPAALLGLNLMAMASSLLMVYISIEMVSLASYLMVGYVSDGEKQSEAAMKYALFGGVCSAIMLYGMSLLYAFTGTLSLSDPQFMIRLAEMPQSVAAIAIILVLVGIGFKLAFVPLHFWSPDVYEGAPIPVTAFLSTGPKMAGFAVLIRFMEPFHIASNTSQGTPVFDFVAILSVIAIGSMIVGNFAAIWQNNMKRMLAYSSIGHTGLILMAIIVNSNDGIKAMLFYLMMYSIANMAAFMIAGKIEEQTGIINISSYKGLGKVFPLEMVCFVIILMSLTGLPPLAGFMGKVLIFSAAIESYSATNSIWMLSLLIVAALTTVVSLFYYFKIPLNAFLRQSDEIFIVKVKRDTLSYISLILTLLLILWGIMPGLLI